MTVLTVTLNAALDVTYEVEALVPPETRRVLQVRERAGGKGVNVARVLRQLGHGAVVAGLAGGRPWPVTLREAVAVAAAAVLIPVAGGFDPEAYRRFHDAVAVRPLGG